MYQGDYAVEREAPTLNAPAAPASSAVESSIASKKSKKRARIEEPAEALPQAGPSTLKGTSKKAQNGRKRRAFEENDMDEDEEEEEEDEELVHESLKAAKSKKQRDRGRTTKYIPPNETSADRDRRTIFVGNLPVDVAKVKVCLSILALGPG